MFIGHFGLGLAAKRLTPGTSLGSLFLGAQFLDLLWPIFIVLGLEHARVVPGITRLTPLDFYDYPISHSLVAAAVWALVVASLVIYFGGDRRAAWVLGALVVSHWVLDVVSHRPDVPVLPGGPYWGLGLWNSVWGTVVVEGALFALGVWSYGTFTRFVDPRGRWGLWSLVAVLTLIQGASYFGPPPPNMRAVSVAGLAIWLLVAWGRWADRHRALVRSGAA